MDDMYISPIYEEIVPVDDGKEIQTVGGWDYLLIWRQKIISELVLYFDDTILYEPLIILSPFLFALLGIIVIAKFGTNKTRKKSPVPEKILAYLKEHPGSTQKQLITAMETSRGSVCYHLSKLQHAARLRTEHSNGVVQYYLPETRTEPDDPLKQSIQKFLARKKAGTVLREMYTHPASTRKDLAAQLGLSPITLRWYLGEFTKNQIITQEKNGNVLRYSLTPDAQTLCHSLITEDTGDHTASAG